MFPSGKVAVRVTGNECRNRVCKTRKKNLAVLSVFIIFVVLSVFYNFAEVLVKLMGKIKNIVSNSMVAAMATMLLLCACGPNEEEKPAGTEAEHAMIMYSAGFNNISTYLREDLADMLSSEAYIPGKYDRKMLFLVSHLPKADWNYSDMTHPSITRVYKNPKGNVCQEVIYKLDSLETLASGQSLAKVFSYISSHYDIKTMGLVVSSHGTGYLPDGYYSNPEKSLSNKARSREEYVEPFPAVEGEPMTKTICQEQFRLDGNLTGYEMDIRDFCSNLPEKGLEYVIFDACHMGGIEVAYELKDKAKVVGFSQAEILADGLNYKKLASRLLEGIEPSPEQVSKDYIEQYLSKSGAECSATWSLVDCRKLEPIADVCGELFSKYGDKIAELDPNISRESGKVQGYWRYMYGMNRPWFYDLYDILEKAGAKKDELSKLKDAIDGAIIYKDATEEFMLSVGGFKVEAFSGLSMFLPSNYLNISQLKEYYKQTAWNQKTHLVK